MACDANQIKILNLILNHKDFYIKRDKLKILQMEAKQKGNIEIVNILDKQMNISAKPPDEITIKKPIIIAMYNNRISVDKSTATYQIASLLSEELMLKVLMIDCDPQINLTNLVLSTKFKNIIKDDNEFKNWLKKYKPDIPIYDDFDRWTYYCEYKRKDPPYINVDITNRYDDNQNRQLLSVIDIFRRQIYFNITYIPILPKDTAKYVNFQIINDNPNLKFLPGNARSHDIYKSNSIHDALSLSNVYGYDMYNGIPYLIKSLFKMIGEKSESHIVLLDLPSSLDKWSSVLLFISDYFIIPTLADQISKNTITYIIPNIINYNLDRHFIKIPKFLGTFIKLPKFLGTFVLNYNNTKKDQKKYIEYMKNEISLMKKDEMKTSNFNTEIPTITNNAYLHKLAASYNLPIVSKKNFHDKLKSKGSKNIDKHLLNIIDIINEYKKAICYLFSNMSDEHLTFLGLNVFNKLEIWGQNVYNMPKDIFGKHELSTKYEPPKKKKKRKKTI
jgi:cellulose biosynthesis protein BcsQ